MHKILFIDSAHHYLNEGLVKHGFQCDLHYDLTREEIMDRLPEYSGVVIRSKMILSKEVLEKGTKLKFIARVGAGMENIDVPCAEAKGIKCLHAPEGNRTAVAEQAIGMLLALFNNLCRANREVREGKWIREGNRGVELEGKTVGVIGYGNTGSEFAHRLVPFGCRVLAHDKYKKGFGTIAVEEVDLEKIFEKADIISIHLPLTEETKWYVDETFISKCKRNFYLINTARGKCVLTSALVEGIKSGKILGACLDVLEFEGVSFENLDASKLPESFQYLVASDKVMLSPHIAGWTHESNEKMARVLLEKILGLFGKS
jgi:D-3-phosphoglycerate dehydrogenase / 2-oxoglutarate reductase